MTKFVALLVIVVNIISGIVSVPGGSSFGGVFKLTLAQGDSPYAFSVAQSDQAEKTEDSIKWYNFLRRAEIANIGLNEAETKSFEAQNNEKKSNVSIKIYQ